jgi:uroporphyrinogen decarboxylase
MNISKKNEKLSSKERVLTVLHKGIPDRTPINYSANPGIDRRLKKLLNIKADDDLGLRQAIGVDFTGIGASYTGGRLHEEISGRCVNPQNGIRTKWIEHESGGYWDYCDFPLKDADNEAVEKWPLPTPDDYDYESLKKKCKEREEYAIFIGGAGLSDIINGNGMLRGMEQVLIDLISDDPVGLRLIQRRLELQLEVLSRTLEIVGPFIDFLWMGEDLGTQKAPLISLDLYRRHLLILPKRITYR